MGFYNRYACRDGSYEWIEWSCWPSPLEKTIASVARVVPEHHAQARVIERANIELERAVAERTQELQAAVKDLESFAYSISHDLRAPLRAIDGFSSILVDEHKDLLTENGQRCLQLIRNSAQNMQALVDGLLKFSRLGQHDLVKQLCSPVVLAEQAIRQLGQDPPKHDVEIDLQKMPECFGDPIVLVQVWANLLSNALKFRRPDVPARIEIGFDNNAYFVRDNGTGLDMRYAEKIFGVFQRLHRAEDFEGTGVGLANVQRILHRHGGTIWVDSQVGVGTTFYFTLPNKEAGS